MRKLINFIIFYVGWLLCSFYHSFNIGLVVLSLALLNILIADYKRKEILLIFALSAVGLLNDLLSIWFRVFEFSYSASVLDWSNIWLFSLWVMFLTTFNSSLAIFRKFNLSVLSLLGAFGGTLSYYAAVKIGVLSTADLNRTILYLVINWSILFPLLYRMYFKILATT